MMEVRNSGGAVLVLGLGVMIWLVWACRSVPRTRLEGTGQGAYFAVALG